jgi:hypothetical protein
MELNNKVDVRSQVDLKPSLVKPDDFDAYQEGGFFCQALHTKMWATTDKNQQPRFVDADVIVHLMLCEKKEAKAIPVWRNNKDHQMNVTDNNGKAQVEFIEEKNASEKEIARSSSLPLLMSVDQLQNKLAENIAYGLDKTVGELSKPRYCLAWAEDQDNTTSYKTNLNQPYAFVTSTITNSEFNTNDTGTLINCDGKFAATVVDGGDNNDKDRVFPRIQLPIFSAIITTAAMHAVEYGALYGLCDEYVQKLFNVTVKLLLSSRNIYLEPDQLPGFKVVVLYEQDGIPKIFANVNGKQRDIEILGNSLSLLLDLSASKDVEGRGVLHVAVDVNKYFIGEDDFMIYSAPEKSSLSKLVENPFESILASTKLELEELESKLVISESKLGISKSSQEDACLITLRKSEISYIKDQIVLRKEEIKNIETQMQSSNTQVYVKQRMLNSNASGFLVNASLIKLELTLSQKIKVIADLKLLKENLEKKQSEMAKVEKLISLENLEKGTELVPLLQEVAALRKKISKQEKKVEEIYNDASDKTRKALDAEMKKQEKVNNILKIQEEAITKGAPKKEETLQQQNLNKNNSSQEKEGIQTKAKDQLELGNQNNVDSVEKENI